MVQQLMFFIKLVFGMQFLLLVLYQEDYTVSTKQFTKILTGLVYHNKGILYSTSIIYFIFFNFLYCLFSLSLPHYYHFTSRAQTTSLQRPALRDWMSLKSWHRISMKYGQNTCWRLVWLRSPVNTISIGQYNISSFFLQEALVWASYG